MCNVYWPAIKLHHCSGGIQNVADCCTAKMCGCACLIFVSVCFKIPYRCGITFGNVGNYVELVDIHATSAKKLQLFALSTVQKG